MDAAAANQVGKRAITRFFEGDVPTIVNASVATTSVDNVYYADSFAKSAIMTDLGHRDWSPMDLGEDKDETIGVLETESTSGVVDHKTRSFAVSQTEGHFTDHYAALQNGNELQILRVRVNNETGGIRSRYQFFDREDPDRKYYAEIKDEWLFAGEGGSKPGSP